jgi:hypothetical protein
VDENNKKKDIRIKLFERFFNDMDFCSFQGGIDFCKALSIAKELKQFQNIKYIYTVTPACPISAWIMCDDDHNWPVTEKFAAISGPEPIITQA